MYASAARSGVLILIGLSLSVLASMFLARHMVQPVRALQAGAARIAAGELDQRLSVHTGDELEALAEEFNHMAAALRDSFAGLEQQVAMRTEALGHAVEQLEDKRRQLETASSHKSGFLAIMSHELRTPLNAILGYTELMLDGIYGELPERLEDVLVRVEKAAGTSSDSSTTCWISLQDRGRAVHTERGRLFHGGPGAHSVGHDGAVGGREEAAFTLELAPELPLGKGDERRISQVLLNLLSNAIKFTEAGEVRLTANAADGVFLLSVCTGPGVAERDRERIFEEFQQVERPGRASKAGTGLGLAIARRIVNLHGGQIWVESRACGGAAFSVRLPTGGTRGAALV